jgi:hypothetical protein
MKGSTMVRAMGRLTALQIEKAKKPGMYPDGGGLYLRVTPEGAKNWVLREHGQVVVRCSR